MPKKSKVVRADDLAPPKRIRTEDFDELCGTFKIPREQKKTLKDYLDELVKALAAWMGKDRSQPDRSVDRERLEKALSLIKEATADSGHMAA
jgi:hypothetical protein